MGHYFVIWSIIKRSVNIFYKTSSWRFCANNNAYFVTWWFQILRGDVNVDKVSYLKVMSTTWKLYLEEAPEAFEVVAYDDHGEYQLQIKILTSFYLRHCFS